METKYIAGLDIGTTSLRCFIYDSKTHVHGRGSHHVSATLVQFINKSESNFLSHVYTQINLLYPKPGYVEIDPDELFESVVTVIKDALAGASVT